MMRAKKKRNITLWIGIGMLFILLFIMYIAPYMPFTDRELTRETHRFTGIPGRMLELPAFGPSWEKPLGTDDLGVDNLSKMMLGAKETIYIVFIVAILRYAMAVPLGLLAYRKRGAAHGVIEGLNFLFTRIPTLIAAIMLLSMPVLLNSENRFVISVFLIALLEVGRVASIIQQEAFKISQEPFIEAGTILGLSPFRMIRKYYFPSLVPQVIINFCVDIGKVMLLIGQLAIIQIFLKTEWRDVTGFGTYQYANDGLNWYALLAEHRYDIYMEKFAFVFAPALAIMFVVLTFNVLGEGLRRHFDRRMHSYL